ncbi:TetR/AcrR family transcriptional regulator [Komagataeibacter xylinus]|uniref:TetR/AcrR family transcriptional regulator n=1 Tax=Komagataeibacter xylinus TaxID=28448 RepID=UPI00280A4E46|nr:TetR/AcrR family transcriptional regulator [Komagataeibacter xylinus]
MKTPTKSSYHHGDLQKALLYTARLMLEKDGIASLKLRAITRNAGVSATAATPHFGNLTGLLSALAAQGFDELSEAMSPVYAKEPRDVGLAYVRFAIANPGLFTLMFRSDAVDSDHPALATASAGAFARLAALPASDQPGISPEAAMACLWAKVHGLAVLAIDGLLAALIRHSGTALTIDQLVEEAFR